jgi:hypothetical protein
MNALLLEVKADTVPIWTAQCYYRGLWRPISFARHPDIYIMLLETTDCPEGKAVLRCNSAEPWDLWCQFSDEIHLQLYRCYYFGRTIKLPESAPDEIPECVLPHRLRNSPMRRGNPEAPPAAVAKPPDKPRPGPPIQLALEFKDGSFFTGYGKGFPRPNFWKQRPKKSDAHQQRLWKGVMKRCGGICEACGENPAKLLHHLNYKRYGHELLTDVVGVCLECHGEFHPEKI